MKWDGLKWIGSLSYKIKRNIELCEEAGISDNNMDYLKKEADELREYSLDALWDRALVTILLVLLIGIEICSLLLCMCGLSGRENS